MTELSIYDTHGEARAYLTDDGTIYTWVGAAVAYLEDDFVYAWRGQHLGWWIDGVMYDGQGCQIGFTQERCPAVTRVERVKSVQQVQGVKSVQRIPRTQPALSLGNSNLDLVAFLENGY